MEVERVTDLQREEEKLMALLAQAEDFTEEQIAALDRELPEFEEALEKLKISQEQVKTLEREKKNLIEFEAMVLKEQEKQQKQQKVKLVDLVDGQSPLKHEEFDRLLRSFPSLKPCPFSAQKCHYFGYSSEKKYFLQVSSLEGDLLLEIDIEKQFLL